MLYPLQQAAPRANLIEANRMAFCKYMKMITLPKLRDSPAGDEVRGQRPGGDRRAGADSDRANGRDRVAVARPRESQVLTSTPEQTASREQLHELAQQLRVDSVRAAAAAGSGHPTSSMSAADLMAVLCSPATSATTSRAPENPANDHLVFSKGHASPLLYSLYKAAGAIDDEELLTFREFGSRLQGHPTPEIPWVDVATGSLGQGLPISVGIALAGARLESRRLPGLGALRRLRAGRGLDVGGLRAGRPRPPRQPDRDRRRQPARPARPDHARVGHLLAGGPRQRPAAGTCRRSTATTSRRSTPPTRRRSTADRPAVIFARTKKGSGVAAVEDKPNQHGKPLADPEAAVAELGGDPLAAGRGRSRRPRRRPSRSPREPVERPAYEVGEKVATRGAYGDALAWLGSVDEQVVALDAEVGNSTYAERFAAKHPDRFFEMYIAEQQMVAAAVGLQTRGWKPFASSFGAFLSRAYDFVRMAAISDADLKLCGSHVGVSIGPDGPSQMALEDIAAFRAVLDSVVLYPCDANQTVQLRRRDARAPRLQLHAHDPRSDPGALRAGRGLRDRRQPHAALRATTTPSP